MVYFSLASIWGCLLGAAALAVAVARSGHRPGVDGQLLAALSGACVLSVVGGAVVAKAYREAANRRRS